MARILIIDDEELVLMTLSGILEMDGHTITTASDGEKGITAFRASPTDIVITDILMPKKQGAETIMELRQIDPDVKIIAMSGGGPMQNSTLYEIAKRLDTTAVLRKPFDIETVCGTVKECLGMAGEVGQSA